MINEDLNALPIERIEALYRELEASLVETRADIRKVYEVLDQRRIIEAVKQDIQRVQDKHNVQILNPDGVPTAEQFGVVGNVDIG